MTSIYDRTDIYDLFNNNKNDEGMKRHWEILLKDRSINKFLDVSIGTGNLSLPLVQMGIKLEGSDISKSMLDKCEKKSNDMGYSIKLLQCDFRNLSEFIKSKYDCVASTGNSLPHVNNDELLKVIEEMDSLVEKGGYIYLDTRNWDKILREKNRFYLYNPAFKEDIRINLVQVWDYNVDGSITFNLLYTFEKNNKIVQREYFEELYYPIKREMIIEKLESLGYGNIEILPFPAFLEGLDIDSCDWYCIMAKKNNN